MREVPRPEESELGCQAPCAGSCHAQRVLQTLNAFRRSGTLTDVVLRAGGRGGAPARGRDFPCHRAALSAGSAYFRGLFAAGRPERGLAVVPVMLEAVEAPGAEPCRPLLLEARACFILGREAGALRARPRRFMDQAEVIVVIGGCDRKGLLKLPFADAYHPESRRWTPLPSLPGYMRSEFAACALRNDIYVSGGHINSRDVWLFSSHLHTWIKVASLHTGRWRHKMAVMQGQLFAVGGFDGRQRLRSVERYDPFSNTWTAAAPLLEAVSSAAIAPCAGRLYVIGGARQDGVNTDKVQCFDPQEDQWSLQSPAPFSQRCLEAVSIEDTIYVVGGLMSKIFTYHPGTNVWGEAAVLPSPVESCGVTVCDGKVYVLGGRDDSGESTDRVLTFDPSCGHVEVQPALQRCTSSHGCVTIVQSLGS
ncbi:LOW QUALITY PROTEIN: kelch-like protein 35 [Tupaia chinensis]|uniref:LOW QUALITY PROTEIN: kelch-like protein 35 n=1 Tax=Tupaia chinensis TaxID=246437 RepID=UPI0003C8C546|nr:LOW QUALITY PROTEIN: kelch-like protein 35 [Tupaia chinensis]